MGRGWIRTVLLVAASAISQHVAAQDQSGSVPKSSVGTIGQRQTIPSVAPLARVNGRLENRVEARLRTRIDQTYDGDISGASRIAAAAVQARIASQPR